MKGLILSAGRGTRLRPITHTRNKHLIPIANKPMIFYPIETMKGAGLTEIGIIVGHTEERIQEIKEAIGDGSQFGVKVAYIEQDAPSGIAHAVKVAKEYLTTNNADGKFVVHLGDNILNKGIKKYVELFKNSDADCLILLKKVDNPNRFGVAEIINGKLTRLIEKPKIPPSNFALVGVYMFNDSIFDILDELKPSARGEYEITEAIQELINSDKRIIHHFVDAGWWKDPGDPEGILEANRLVLDELVPFNKGIVEGSVELSGKIMIGEGTIVKSGSSIKGPVIIGKNCLIGENSSIGPYTSIGDNTVIKNAEIEYSLIMGDSKIDCKHKISDSLVGKNVVIEQAPDQFPGTSRIIVGENSFLTL